MPSSESATEVVINPESQLLSDARSFALFFFFALLDETMAVDAAERAISAWKASANSAASGSGKTPAGNRAQFVRLCKRRIDAERALQRSERKRGATGREERIGASAPGGDGSSWKVSDADTMAAWIRFAREASDDEVNALILTRVLKIDENDVAIGLATSIGALRNRIGRAARALGAAAKAQAS